MLLLTKTQAQRVWDVLTSRQDFVGTRRLAMVLLALDSGTKIKIMCRAKMSKVFIAEKELRYFGRKHRRCVNLSDATLEAIALWTAQRGSHLSERLFVHRDGQKFTRECVHAELAAIREAAGIRGFPLDRPAMFIAALRNAMKEHNKNVA